VLNGRIYRAAFIPLLIALAIAGFSLTAPARELSSTLAPDAFNGSTAFAELKSLAEQFPVRRPGSRGDAALASYIARTLEGLGGSASAGFSVHTRQIQAQTIDGQRSLTTVIARRPGITGGSPIVLLAHRDAARRGAAAELSGTAVLLELARVLATSETQRTVIVVSTSGGSGGDAGALDFATHSGGPVDGAIVLGDLAGVSAHKPFLVPYSAGLGSAPGSLQRTVAAALTHEVGVDPGAPSTLSQLAHLALPLTAGEQGVLGAHGIPAVLVQVSGERPPAAGEALSATRLQNFGRAVLSSVYALDGNPSLGAVAGGGAGGGAAGNASAGGGGVGAGSLAAGGGGLDTALPIQRKLLPAWALRLILATLLLPPLLVLVDGFARARRRRLAVGRRLRWALACALPFLLVAVLTRLLGVSGALAAPAGPVLAQALPSGAVAVEAVLAPLLLLVLCWLAWPPLARGLRLHPRADDDAAALALLLVLLAVTVVVWVFNPFTALLLLPALHLWLPLAQPAWRSAGGRPLRLRALVLVALGLVPLVLLIAFYARQLGFGPVQAAHAAVLLLAGGWVAIPALLLWCLAFGCLAAAVLVAVGAPAPAIAGPDCDEEIPITVRGPMSYAGPGSLGGTESALRR
jgi:Peptidase family M28